MAVENLLPKILPVLDWIRNIIMKLAELLSKQIQTDAMNIYNIIIFLFAFWLANKILGKNYTTMDGRFGYLVILGGLIFYVLRFLGVTN